MDKHGKPQIGLIVGPTASGKTAASICLANKLNAEILSADSIQIYKGMDIGSAKPTMEERQGIPHHLMDAIEPDSPGFSVAEYQRMAAATIDDVLGRGKYPLIVGGSGLYINSITYPLDFTSVASDPALRAELEAMEAAEKGSLYRLLRQEDPAAAARLHPNDIKRIVRALEVLRLTGRAMDSHGGDFDNAAGREIPYSPRMAGITMPREQLYGRINRRVEIMLEAGLLAEARALYDSGLNLSLPALQGLGYRQLFRHFAGECSLEEAIEAVKQETRRFAKRQLTWFRRDKRIVWFDASEYAGPEELAVDMYDKVFSREVP